MKNNEIYHAINCRIPKETYENLQAMLEITGKNVSATVADAIVYYMNCVKGENEPTNSLQIDQFAWNLKKKGNKHK